MLLQWDMTPEEKEVCSYAILYVNEFRKLYNNNCDGETVRRNSLPKKNDPRKSSVFRHCWKMKRETRGLLESHEYKNYIYANLLIIKLNKGYIQPNCICGDKAWMRYKVWKRLYDRKLEEKNAILPQNKINNAILSDIDRTKKFIFEQCKGEVSKEKIVNFINQGKFVLWTAKGNVSPYYVVMSPFFENIDIKNMTGNSSLSVIKEKITKEIKNYFESEFKHEFL